MKIYRFVVLCCAVCVFVCASAFAPHDSAKSQGISNSYSTIVTHQSDRVNPAIASPPLRDPTPDKDAPEDPFDSMMDLWRRLLWMMRKNARASAIAFPILEVDAGFANEK